MQQKRGDMFLAPKPNLMLVTGNSFLTKGGDVVMGAGAALKLKVAMPGVDTWFGQEINRICGSLGMYGLIVHPQRNIGLFQTKYHFKNNADIDLIQESSYHLNIWLSENGNEDRVVYLNYPGIGNGRLPIGDVEPIVNQLPDNVIVWRM
jgi:hypothetical protein